MRTTLLSGNHNGLSEQVLRFDHWLFSKINQDWTNSFFDFIFPYLRQAELWIPLYLFLFVLALTNFRLKGFWWGACVGMTAVISDLFSSHLMKIFFFRLRPCQNPALADQMRVLVNYCPKSSSFTSSHACNHFALAFFIFLTLNRTAPWRWLFLLWAFLISYAQVYVGVHYPFDVLSGGVFGCGIGYLMTIFFQKQFGALSVKQTAAWSKS